MSDRIAVINSGRIVQLDTPRALYETPGKPLRRRLHRRIDVCCRSTSRRRAALSRATAALRTARRRPDSGRCCWCCGRSSCAFVDRREPATASNVLDAARSQDIVYQGDSVLLQVGAGRRQRDQRARRIAASRGAACRSAGERGAAGARCRRHGARAGGGALHERARRAHDATATRAALRARRAGASGWRCSASPCRRSCWSASSCC